MKNTLQILLTLTATLSTIFAAEPEAEQTTKKHRAEQMAQEPAKKLLKISELNPKRPGAWYTKHEYTAAIALIQKTKPDGDSQKAALVNAFNTDRGLALFHHLASGSTPLKFVDIDAMKAATETVHDSERADFANTLANL